MSEPQKTLTPKTAAFMGLIIAESDRLLGDGAIYPLYKSQTRLGGY